ncbi:Hypothetical predicted protein [Cloeon dipterum]|uniref:N-acetyltransferase domain-containing protein n=1 Tax=Cloeon dipterum TaxID=197152 RepID=A0A8S1DYY0_9INSE|nr:Hypothetical predicted protein [Cloeon dipterum]
MVVAAPKLRIPLEDLGTNPQVWKQVPGYIIRNCSPDLVESVVYHMTTYFINEEPFCSNSEVSKDPVSMEEISEWWRDLIKQNLTLIALPEKSQGADCKPISEPRIPLAGVNVLMLGVKDEPKVKIEDQFTGKNIIRALAPYAKISAQVDCFKEYGVDVYMDAAGLSVHKEHRGRKLGEALLKARFQMCWTLGIKVTKTVFTSVASQITAFRCNMEKVKEIEYKDIKDEKTGELAFPNVDPRRTVHVCIRVLQDSLGNRAFSVSDNSD